MPLEGWKNLQVGHTMREAISQHQANTAASAPAESIGGQAFSKSQHVPKGFQHANVIPTWVNHEGQFKYRVVAANLNHAIRIPGTTHILTSDVKLTNQQIESLANDFKAVTEKIGHKFPNGIAMHVPGGRGNPRNARGWVVDKPGVRTLYVRPSIAKGSGEDEEAAYQSRMAVNDRLAGHPFHMPAAKINGRQYTIFHESGHLNDAQNDHTKSFGGRTGDSDSLSFWNSQKGSGGRPNTAALAAAVSSASSQQLFSAALSVPAQTTGTGLSRYGRSDVSEGYAEAFAQYFLGGKGSNATADAYARKYGW